MTYNFNLPEFSNPKIIVLKFGHSILQSKDDIQHVINESYRYLKLGYKVLVVVSALGNNTNLLNEASTQIYQDQQEQPEQEALAELLATGEISSAALVAIGFNQVGVKALKLSSHNLLFTNNNILDATPLEFDTAKVKQLFNTYSVLVLPGFIGCTTEGKTTLLGRGGSDLSAVFCAVALKAQQCVLHKDSGGVLCDSKKSGIIYKQISYKKCADISNQIVQHKALNYASEHNLGILIKGLNTNYGTYITTHDSVEQISIKKPKKYKILLFGLGTVGLGVFHNLRENDAIFEIVGIGVKNVAKHKKHAIQPELISSDLDELIKRDYDILIGAIGGLTELPYIAEALNAKKHVITANKFLIAEKGKELYDLAKANNVVLKYSAAVAGVIPVLEVIENLKQEHQDFKINAVSGVLNGTCNFILDKISSGVSLSDAIAIAQRAGYAEADPSFDIEGIDALHKIIIIARLVFGTEPVQLQVNGLANSEQLINQAKTRGNLIKLIATVANINNNATVKVELVEVTTNSVFAKATGADNCVVINADNGESIVLHGRGAGRLPTALAVYSDLLNIVIKEENL